MAETITTQELAEAVDCPVETIREWIESGELDAVQIEDEYRISKTDANEWWQSRGGGELFETTAERSSPTLVVESYGDEKRRETIGDASPEDLDEAIGTAEEWFESTGDTAAVEVYLPDTPGRENDFTVLAGIAGERKVWKMTWSPVEGGERRRGTPVTGYDLEDIRAAIRDAGDE